METQTKISLPTLDKDIITTVNNSKEGRETPVEAASYNVGDIVTYELVGTLPSNYDAYQIYYYRFNDNLYAGQEYQGDLKVWLDNGTGKEDWVDITEYFEIKTVDKQSSTSYNTYSWKQITVDREDLKTIPGVTITKDSVIRVRYSAKLVGAEPCRGYRNTANLYYSNNPNLYQQDGVGSTQYDDTEVVSFRVVVTKVDSTDSSKVLSGAQFALKAKDGEHKGKYAIFDAQTGVLTGWTDEKPSAVETPPASGNTSVLVTGTDGRFSMSGLGAGKYDLEELKAPAGYNSLLRPAELEIAATFLGGDTETHDQVNPIGLSSFAAIVDGNRIEGDSFNRNLYAKVENLAGTLLPSTGGIGTRAFYLAGILLTAGTGVVLAARRRKARGGQRIMRSADWRLLKPEPAFFEKALELFDLDRRACVFIDDSPINVESAVRLGLPGIVFHGDAQRLRRELQAREVGL